MTNPGAQPTGWLHSGHSAVHASVPSAEVEEGLAAIRERLTPEELEATEDVTIRRFIHATHGNLDLSTKRLKATLVWRAKNRPEEVVCTACAANPRSHYMHLVGYDVEKRPVIYSCLALAQDRGFETNKAHMINTFETAVRAMAPPQEQWVWVCDFWGFGMADVNTRLARLFLEVSADHYPERLGYFLVVDAPRIFDLLWHALQPFIDPKTRTKIRFLPFDEPKGEKSKLRAALVESFQPQTAQWLLQEMVQNRDKKQLKKKAYSYSDLYTYALQQQEQEQQREQEKQLEEEEQHQQEQRQLQLHQQQEAQKGTHDLRGSSDMLKQYLAQPSLLLPQALAQPT